MKQTLPKVSVVVATHNRADLLQHLLHALKQQTLSTADYEVIIASDGSTDNTVALLQTAQQTMPQLHWLDLPKGNPGRTRNRGAQKAKAPIIAFTDDDCLPQSDWLATIVAKFEKECPATVGLQGKTTTNTNHVTPLTHQIENLKGHPAVPTCNAAYLKEIFFKVGGFDENFPFAHNEDADLAWRIAEEGNIAFVPEMVVDHPPRPVSFAKMSQRMKILTSEFMLFHKNPTLYRRWRQHSPWQTIYGEVFLKHKPALLRSRLRFINRPFLMLAGIALNIVWWLDLLIKLPSFWKADRKYQAHYRNPSPA